MPEKNDKQTMLGKNDTRKSDYITNKVLLVFSGCLLGVLGLMFLNNVLNYSIYWATGLKAIQILRVVGPILTVLGIIIMISQRMRGIDLTYRVLKGSTLVTFGIIVTIVFAVIGYNQNSGIKLMYVMLPTFAFAYLIYHSYQPEFFVIALDCALAAGAVAAGQTTYGAPYHMVLLGIVLVLFIIQLIGVAKVRSDLGRVRLGKKYRYTFEFSNNAYLMMFLTPVFMAGLAAAGLLMDGRASLVSLIAVGIYFFVTAVYYTVKLV